MLEANIALIGAGPAGLMAAAAAARSGASVVLFDANAWPGGRLGLQTQPLQGPRSMYGNMNGIEFCRMLLDDALDSGVTVNLETSITEVTRAASIPGLFRLTYAPSDSPPKSLEAKAVILANGSREPWYDFPGSKLNGMMLSGDAQTMLNVRGKLPGKRVLMVGSDNAGLLISANLIDAGAQVVAVVDESSRIIGREFNAAPLRNAGVEILTSTKVLEAHGFNRVESVTIENIDSSSKRVFEIDTLILAGPRTPESKLASMLNVSFDHQEILGGPTPVHNRRMETPVPGAYVCGDASGVENGAAALESGRLAGLYASRSLGYSLSDAPNQEKLARARLGYLRRGRRGAMRREAKARLASLCT